MGFYPAGAASETLTERDANGARGQRHVPGHVDSLQEEGNDGVEGQDEPAKSNDPSQPSRYSSISPTEGIIFQDGQELTTNGQTSARRSPVEVVRGESCGKVLSCSPSTARVAEVDLPDAMDLASLRSESGENSEQ